VWDSLPAYSARAYSMPIAIHLERTPSPAAGHPAEQLALRHPGRQPAKPRPRGFELGGELQQPVLFAETRDELHTERQPIRGPVQGHAHRRCARQIGELLMERLAKTKPRSKS
jgi:hypothetical protein